MVPTPSSRRASTPRTRARRTVDEPTSRKRAGARAAWITDPCALLEALAACERAAEEAETRRPPPPQIDTMWVTPVVDDSPTEALPSLRDDERLAHPPHAGVVVIIRRRRAA